MRFLKALAWLAAVAPAAALAGDIVVAQVAPFSGPLAQNGEQNWLGSRIYFDHVNAAGGLNGSRVRFVREDDRYQPAETIRLIDQVAQRDKPVAFVNLLGSANVTLLMQKKVLEQAGIPAVGVTPGSDTLRTPGSPQIFHVQAGDRAQIRKLVNHLATIGVQRIAVVYQDNPFGKSGLALVQELAPPQKLRVVGAVPMAPAADSAADAVRRLHDVNAQSYFMILAPNSASAFVRDLRRSGDRTPVYGLSYASADSIVKAAGADGSAGVGLAQVVPNPAVPSTRLTSDYLADLKRFGPPDAVPGAASLAGYISARVVVEALRRVGPAPTPSKLAAALRELRGVDIGGYVVDLAPGPFTGSTYVDVAVIDSGGRLRY
jgi:branched-chain amino acid transport system substrate-binding protein